MQKLHAAGISIVPANRDTIVAVLKDGTKIPMHEHMEVPAGTIYIERRCITGRKEMFAYAHK